MSIYEAQTGYKVAKAKIGEGVVLMEHVKKHPEVDGTTKFIDLTDTYRSQLPHLRFVERHDAGYDPETFLTEEEK